MDIAPGDILRDTEPTPVPGVPGRYTLVIPDAWRIFYAFGGATMAATLRAATAEIERPDLTLLSADATFCQAVPCGPVAVQVETLRQGRTAAQTLVRLWALDPASPDPAGPVGNDLVVTCVFGALFDSSPFRFVGAEFPQVAAPADCVGRLADDPDSPFATIPYHQQTEFRVAGDPFPLGEDTEPGEPCSVSWFRFNVPPLLEDGTWEPSSLALPGDILGPAVHRGLGGGVGFFLVISLQISLQFVAPLRTDWLLQHTRAHVGADGYSSGTAELWSSEGELVAIATQCAKLQPMKRG